jgi:hypothetical protein
LARVCCREGEFPRADYDKLGRTIFYAETSSFAYKTTAPVVVTTIVYQRLNRPFSRLGHCIPPQITTCVSKYHVVHSEQGVQLPFDPAHHSAYRCDPPIKTPDPIGTRNKYMRVVSTAHIRSTYMLSVEAVLDSSSLMTRTRWRNPPSPSHSLPAGLSSRPTQMNGFP